MTRREKKQKKDKAKRLRKGMLRLMPIPANRKHKVKKAYKRKENKVTKEEVYDSYYCDKA
jgi:hypothetical protein